MKKSYKEMSQEFGKFNRKHKMTNVLKYWKVAIIGVYILAFTISASAEYTKQTISFHEWANLGQEQGFVEPMYREEVWNGHQVTIQDFKNIKYLESVDDITK